MIRRTITAHISPYFGGLAPETHDYVRYLNDEARRRKSGVIWIALRNRILVHGDLNRALKSTASLGTLMLRDALSAGYLAHKPQPFWETAAIEGEEPVLRRGNSSYKKELRRLDKNWGRANSSTSAPVRFMGLSDHRIAFGLTTARPGLASCIPLQSATYIALLLQSPGQSATVTGFIPPTLLRRMLLDMSPRETDTAGGRALSSVFATMRSIARSCGAIVRKRHLSSGRWRPRLRPLIWNGSPSWPPMRVL